MVSLTFETDNAAFIDDGSEIPRILRAIADKVESGQWRGIVQDVNGNTIGEYSFE